MPENASEQDIVTLRKRMETTTNILDDCATHLGVSPAVSEMPKKVGETPIDQLMAGFAELDGLGKAILNEVHRL